LSPLLDTLVRRANMFCSMGSGSDCWDPLPLARASHQRRRGIALFASFAAVLLVYQHADAFAFAAGRRSQVGSLARPGLGRQALRSTLAVQDGTIFVSIAAYADPELPVTMQSLLAAASRPELIRFGIVWQGPGRGLDDQDMTVLRELWNVSVQSERQDEELQLPTGIKMPVWDMMEGRIRSIHMAPEEARGPCWARYLAQLLWRGEDLYLQLDSHMRFVPGWDDKAREELAWCTSHSDKPVICTYGPGYRLGMPYNEIPPGRQASMNCANTFDSDGLLLIKARELASPLPEPTKHFFWGAQFSFSSSEILCEVPYDPGLQMLFFGEEISMAVRLYTHGWDVYAPKENLFFHLWDRDYRRVYWKDNRALFASLLRASQCRVQSLLSGGTQAADVAWPLPGGGTAPTTGPDAFGLGQQRSLQSYQEESGVDFQDKRLQAKALRGGGFALSEQHFSEPAIMTEDALQISGAPEELSYLAGVPFVPDAAVNGAPSYVARLDAGRLVLWYSSTNRTWILNSGGVAHGLGQEAMPLIFSHGVVGSPTDACEWRYFDSFMGGWIPSRNLRFQRVQEEDEEEAAEDWLESMVRLASPLIPRYQ